MLDIVEAKLLPCQADLKSLGVEVLQQREADQHTVYFRAPKIVGEEIFEKVRRSSLRDLLEPETDNLSGAVLGHRYGLKGDLDLDSALYNYWQAQGTPKLGEEDWFAKWEIGFEFSQEDKSRRLIVVDGSLTAGQFPFITRVVGWNNSISSVNNHRNISRRFNGEGEALLFASVARDLYTSRIKP